MLLDVIIRTPQRDRFVVIAKAALEDGRLSWKARGILAYLLTKPDSWRVYSKQVVSAGPDGRDAVLAAFRELEQFGYMRRARRQHSSAGTFDGLDVEVFETPQDVNPQVSADAENPFVVESRSASCTDADYPDTANPHLVNMTSREDEGFSEELTRVNRSKNLVRGAR